MKRIFLFAVFVILVISGCNKDDNNSSTKPVSKEKISGYVQKGPFINGSTITLSELDGKMNPTGRTFRTEISDNTGQFEMTNIELVSQYAEIQGDGFYFNEVTGETSPASLKLTTLVDLSTQCTVNINALSHLERSRAIYLMNNQEMSFDDAKKQALKEVLAMFSIEKNDIDDTENLDITKIGDDHAILLAVSIILQGKRTTAELSELLANINTDLREDGTLDNATLQLMLIDKAGAIDLAKVRQNLEQRCQKAGIIPQIPNFEKYVKVFIENTLYTKPSIGEYPMRGVSGWVNIFHPDVIEIHNVYHQAGFCCIAANVPKYASLKIVVHNGKKINFPVNSSDINAFDRSNWLRTYNPANNTMTFEVVEDGKPSDYAIVQLHEGEYIIDYYENNAASPSYSKTITATNSVPNQ